MNNIKVLDCTLRDGGYCNNWQFGQKNIRTILKKLVSSGIDIIECGFLTEKCKYDENCTLFNSIDELKTLLPKKHGKTTFVLMANFGEYDFSKLSFCDGTVDGIRVAFHKKDMDMALSDCKIIAEKGYKVFIQPMVSLCYSDNEFLDLIYKSNEIKPYAFYIVDSFGAMKRKDLTRLFYIVEHNLDEKIKIGFHSHNNMQLAYSNAQKLIDIQTLRDIIIDASVYGMGRGAGNLNTELFTDCLNECRGAKYDIKPLLGIIDESLSFFYQQKKWGYSLPNYLSALYSAHPNYAFYLDDKKTLTVESMNEIFLRMDADKKYEFDKNYIECLYLKYMETGKIFDAHKTELCSILTGKEVLLIGPGKSSEICKDKICEYAKTKGTVSIAVNFDYPYLKTDFVFISNQRRFRDFPEKKYGKCIITSNISADNVYLKTEYKALLNDVDSVRDNAGLMAISFLINMGIKKVTLAGFDGYSHDNNSNYAEKKLSFFMNDTMIDAINAGMKQVLEDLGRVIEICFLNY